MICYIFPGQGSQFKGMGGDLFDAFPEKEKEADEILGYSIRTLCNEDPVSNLNLTQYTQPAMYVINALSYLQEIKRTGFRPHYLAGHSLGEYNALNASGVLTFGDGLRLVKKRGELMSHAKSGAMAAVLNLPGDEIKRILNDNGLTDVDIANYNAKTQIVISGVKDEIVNSRQYIESAGGVFIPLNTSGAFHSRLMGSAAKEFGEYLKNFKFGKISIPVISNVTAELYVHTDVENNLQKQIAGSVLWYQSIESLLSRGVCEFREIGAGDVLTKLLKKIKAYYKESSASQVKNLYVNRSDEAQCDVDDIVQEWNTNHRVGESVYVKGLGGYWITRSVAKKIFGFRPAIYLEGVEGYIPLSEIS